MFIYRQLGLLFGLPAGITASQLPEITQQYRQRRGGAMDELQRIVTDFDRDAKTYGMTRSQGPERLTGDKDLFVGQPGRRMAETNARLSRLKQQRDAFANTGSITRVAVCGIYLAGRSSACASVV